MTPLDIVSVMKAGATLHMELTKDGPQYWLSCSKVPVLYNVAQSVIRNPAIHGCGDCLWDSAEQMSQTYRAD